MGKLTAAVRIGLSHNRKTNCPLEYHSDHALQHSIPGLNLLYSNFGRRVNRNATENIFCLVIDERAAL